MSSSGCSWGPSNQFTLGYFWSGGAEEGGRPWASVPTLYPVKQRISFRLITPSSGPRMDLVTGSSKTRGIRASAGGCFTVFADSLVKAVAVIPPISPCPRSSYFGHRLISIG